ncbi:hypothetical protein IC582_010904 [Cucumis melo]
MTKNQLNCREKLKGSCVRLWKLFCFEGYLSLFIGNQIYMSSGQKELNRAYDQGSSLRR